jgi:hypothetical protein
MLSGLVVAKRRIEEQGDPDGWTFMRDSSV